MTELADKEIVELDAIVFTDLIVFQKEIANPLLMKQEMDKLIRRLGKYKYKHHHKVITKVLKRNEIKKTINILIMVPIVKDYDLTPFLEQYDQYSYVEEFILKKSSKISIPNDMDEFKRAVQSFIHYSEANEIKDLDLKNNPIIEVAKVDTSGTIIGFDLHMEKM